MTDIEFLFDLNARGLVNMTPPRKREAKKGDLAYRVNITHEDSKRLSRLTVTHMHVTKRMKVSTFTAHIQDAQKTIANRVALKLEGKRPDLFPREM